MFGPRLHTNLKANGLYIGSTVHASKRHEAGPMPSERPNTVTLQGTSSRESATISKHAPCQNKKNNDKAQAMKFHSLEIPQPAPLPFLTPFPNFTKATNSEPWTCTILPGPTLCLTPRACLFISPKFRCFAVFSWKNYGQIVFQILLPSCADLSPRRRTPRTPPEP